MMVQEHWLAHVIIQQDVISFWETKTMENGWREEEKKTYDKLVYVWYVI